MKIEFGIQSNPSETSVYRHAYAYMHNMHSQFAGTVIYINMYVQHIHNGCMTP